MQIFSREEDTRPRGPEVSSQMRDYLNVPSCVAVVEDYDYEADNGHYQDVLAGDEQDSEDLPEIGTWGQKEDAADIKSGVTKIGSCSRWSRGSAKYSQIV